MAGQETVHISVPGYEGINFDAIPEGLRERVEAAVETVKGTTLGLKVTQNPTGVIWPFGEYTDVYVVDGSSYHESYHRVGNLMYSVSLFGSSSAQESKSVATALGFDQEHADIIPGYGWYNKPSPSTIEYELNPSGPYYGQKTDYHQASLPQAA